jgi:hypothetical protein
VLSLPESNGLRTQEEELSGMEAKGTDAASQALGRFIAPFHQAV